MKNTMNRKLTNTYFALSAITQGLKNELYYIASIYMHQPTNPLIPNDILALMRFRRITSIFLER